mmetsp:Transcript_16551/g.53902  ORF Transcript_16551/g.53902 Transcript_16551/m.53902 type:complete len:397 (+) Transcript_16551:2-1192(+)
MGSLVTFFSCWRDLSWPEVDRVVGLLSVIVGVSLLVVTLVLSEFVAFWRLFFILAVGLVLRRVLERFEELFSPKTPKQKLLSLTAPEKEFFLEPPLLDFGQRPEILCVVDFECTCDEPNVARHEIIEFPVVIVDLRTGALGPTFRSFVKPTERPVLSTFCRKLTGIEQKDVDDAPTLDVVLRRVDDWLKEKQQGAATTTFAFAADSPFDFRKFLHPECERKGFSLPSYYWRWVDISKHLLHFYPNTRCPLAEKLRRVGLDYRGRPHSGLDDANNIARLAQLLAPKKTKHGKPSLAVNDGFSKHRLMSLKLQQQHRKKNQGPASSNSNAASASSSTQRRQRRADGNADSNSNSSLLGQRKRRDHPKDDSPLVDEWLEDCLQATTRRPPPHRRRRVPR